jgi:DNA-binding MarR family transcriptional regulator
MKKTNTPQAIELTSLAGDLRITMGKLVRRLREHAQAGDLTSAQKSILIRLEKEGPATVSDLARAEGVKPQSMRVTVASLETSGAIAKRADPNDRRKTFVELTAEFKGKVHASRAAKEDWLHLALQSQLTQAEQRELAACIRLIERLAEF